VVVAILIPEKVDIKLKLVRRDKEGHYIEKITIVNSHDPNTIAPNFIKHTLLNLQTQLDPSRGMVVDFSTLLSPTDRSSRQKLNRETGIE
jgi:RNA binding exosome subunit